MVPYKNLKLYSKNTIIQILSEDNSKKIQLPKDPEAFDSSIDVIGRPGKLWLAALSGVGFLSFIWTIFGTIKIEETTPSIFLFKSTVATN